MRDLRSPAIAELARQLLRGPARLRLRQLFNIEFVLSIVQPQKAYPADFIWHALTGYRAAPGNPSPWDGQLIDGEMVIGDLVQLAERLSEDADIRLEHWRGAAYTVNELAQRFDVSAKTICRWRQRGLVAWKFRCPDRRMRPLFPDQSVRRFVAQNTDLVQRGSSFSQLTAQERARILALAREYAAEGRATMHAVAKRIAAETGRAVETVRLVLKAHDAAHPERGLFNRALLAAEGDERQLAIWEAYQDGAPLETLARRFGQSVGWIYRCITRMRARELKTRKIEYVGSPEFDRPGAAADILNHPAANSPYRTEAGAARHVPADLPPYLRQLFYLPLLTPEGEAALFRKMNYLKYEADRLRQAVDVETVTPAELDRIEARLVEANRVKNQITQANLRLVVSLAKRHLSPTVDFYEIVSDGNVSLMRAAEKFDYTRGFKFSTYASWAIMRNYARLIPEQRYYGERYQTGREDWLEKCTEAAPEERDDEQLAAVRGAVERMLAALEPREQQILRERFGLDGAGEPRTLEQIGRRLGVSKERVRQIENRAIGKLRGGFGADVPGLLRG